jgi:flagellar biosynthesis GTPase FlhF
MATLDTEIDRLYQLPLAEFTAARNALAKRAGDGRTAVQALQKPTAAAWAVNQLYWQRRPTFNRLVAAAERLRAAHARVLTGHRADVPAAERAHAEAVRGALDDIQRVMGAAGEQPSPAVLNDIRDTLQALPSDEPPGRLARPMAPLGFAALLKMLPGGAEGAGPKAPVFAGPVGVPAPEKAVPAGKQDAALRRRDQAEAARAEREAKRAAAERKRQRAALERQIREARAAEREREAALSKLRDELARVEREEQRRQAALEAQKFEVRRVAGEVARQEQEARGAAEARLALEAELAALGIKTR